MLESPSRHRGMATLPASNHGNRGCDLPSAAPLSIVTSHSLPLIPWVFTYHLSCDPGGPAQPGRGGDRVGLVAFAVPPRVARGRLRLAAEAENLPCSKDAPLLDELRLQGDLGTGEGL
jgi:hypothetical protein